MRKWMLVLWAALFLLPVSQDAFAASKKKKKKEVVTEKKDVKSESAYDKLVKKAGATSAKSNFITVHKIDGKVYFEIPFKYFDRDMLLASTLTEISQSMFGDVGYKASTPLHVKFVKGDSAVFLKTVGTTATADPNTPQELAMSKSFGDAVFGKYKIETYNNDKSAIVIDVTDLFLGNVKEFEFFPYMGMLTVKGDFKKENSALGDIKSFDDNLSVKSLMSYKCSIGFWILTFLSDYPVTATVTRTLMLLPEEPMRPRLADARVGIFLDNKMHISNKEDGIKDYSLANRWRIEPKDAAAYQRGELVEPIKPIVFYVDDAFPTEWISSVKEGVLVWNKAFEKIGFKNAIQVRDYPKNDPSFDPDNLKYSCVRYIASTTANAMGPSWTDPRSGEIINASVLIYNDVIRLLNNWCFVQTAQVDPRVRAKKLPYDVMNEAMVYVVAHEIGHTLGAMHNMASSSAFPVDSLRSVTFTQKYGTTPSIMDYARFNYVAQPEDKGVKLTPPDLGIYDYFLIEYAYKPVPEAKDMWEEGTIIEKWVDAKAGDPLYRYGRQQLLSRYDPSALEEDLGNDPIKASTYGVKNLKYILANLDQWIEDDADYSHRRDLYNQLANQYLRYIMNVSMNVGGIYLKDVKEGTPGQPYVSVPKDVQKASLAWVLNEYRNSDWLNNTPLIKKFPMGVDMPTLLQTKLIGNLQQLVSNVTLSAYISSNPYSVQEFLTDLFNGAFENTIKGNKLTEGEKIMQRALVDMIIAPLADKKESGGLFGLTAAYAPSLDQILTYNLDPTGLVAKYEDQLRQVEQEHGVCCVAAKLKKDNNFGNGYGFLEKVNVKAIDNSSEYLIDLAFKGQKLINSKVATSTGADRLHYQALAAKINKTLKNK